MFIGLRIFILFIVLIGSFIIPDINFLLIILGSIFGTIITYIMPVMFYNKAYSNSPRNTNLDRGQNNSIPNLLEEEKKLIIENQDENNEI